MNVGDLVIWHGRVFRICGFDPMSVPDRRALLEDPDTGEVVRAPVDEVEPRDGSA